MGWNLGQEESKEEDAVVIDSETDETVHAVWLLTQRKTKAEQEQPQPEGHLSIWEVFMVGDSTPTELIDTVLRERIQDG